MHQYFRSPNILALAAAALIAGCTNMAAPDTLSADAEAEKAEIAKLAQWLDEHKVCPGGYRITRRPARAQESSAKRAYHVICTPTTRSA
jgi:outer membrane murein-binding lipoprotein Lpp